MRSTRTLKRSALAVACGALLMVLGGCPKHENLPAEIGLEVPPTPSNFAITVADDTADYTFEWEISDPTNVKNYRLYLIGLAPTPELLAEPTATTESRTLPYRVTGLQFGVSAVGTDNVEGAMVVQTAP